MLRMGTALAAILALSVVLAACGEEPTPTPTPAPTATATATPQAEPTPADNASGEPDSTPDEPIDLPEHIREKTAQLWEVYNHYDADGLEVFYEPSYWAEEEKEVRSNLQPFKNFGLEIRPEETSPPTEIEPGKWEFRQTARWDGGSVKMVFIYEEFGGEWLLTYAETD